MAISGKKTDRRVSRTRRSLRRALQALVLEKGYDTVTVEEITDRADVGRTTFYLHYKDKEDLLLESVSALVDDLVEHISHIPISAWTREDEEASTPILLTFEHASENADLYRIILRGEGSWKVAKRLRGIIAQATQAFLRHKIQHEKLELPPEIPMEVFSSYVAGSWVGVIAWWLEEAKPYPPQRMAKMFQRMFMLGVRGVLGGAASEP